MPLRWNHRRVSRVPQIGQGTPSAKLLEHIRCNDCKDSNGIFWPQEVIGELCRAVSSMGQWQIIAIHYFYKKKGKRIFFPLPLSQNEFYVCKEHQANGPQRLKFSINSQDSDLAEQKQHMNLLSESSQHPSNWLQEPSCSAHLTPCTTALSMRREVLKAQHLTFSADPADELVRTDQTQMWTCTH